ncbi:MAG: biotin/lipoyl-binding protein [Thermoplasmata archaeon]|nr:biotin/lipoyl-binding protein [Thermoplasmata archaeon]
MRIVVTLDTERREIDVGPDGTEVRWGDRSAVVKVIPGSGRSIELEIGGERAVVEGWPEHLSDPPREIVINGETFALSLERVALPHGEAGRIALEVPVLGPIAAPTPPAAAAGGGIAVAPPMPGRVVELRVKDGDRVTAGQVLLVLEAMKMRNEVTSPTSGVVRGVAVSAGSNVRARETMLRVLPE